MVMSSRSALFWRRGWLSTSAPASVVVSIRNVFSLPFFPLALSRKGMYFQQQTGLCSLKGIEPVSGGAPDCVFFVQDMAWRPVVSCVPTTIIMAHPTNKFRRVMQTQAPA